jgi:serine/threonine protein kinase
MVSRQKTFQVEDVEHPTTHPTTHATAAERLLDICPVFVESFTKYVDVRPTKVGSGSFGDVYVGRPTPEGIRDLGLPSDRKVAIKMIKKRMVDPDLVINETTLLREIDLEHVPKMYGCFSTERFIMIIMEYIDGVDLFDHLPKITARQAKHIVKIIGRTLFSLHENNISHRDIKPENIMYSPKTRDIYLVDFGLSCKGSGCLYPAGSYVYIDPRLVELDTFSFEDFVTADWWSFLITAYVIFTGESPYSRWFLHLLTTSKLKTFPYKREMKADGEHLDLSLGKYVPRPIFEVIHRCLLDPYNLEIRPSGAEMMRIMDAL